MLNKFLEIDKIEVLEQIVEGAKIRIEKHIFNGGHYTDKYVEKQNEIIIDAHERIDQIRELEKEKEMEKEREFTLEL